MVDVETANKKNKKKNIEQIRAKLRNFFGEQKFEKFKEKDAKLDLAIFIEVSSHRYKTQDIDNILKIVLDAIQRDKKDSSWKYLCEKDSQIYRILAWKDIVEKVGDYNTASVTLSFRTHDPSRQMTMKSYREDSPFL